MVLVVIPTYKRIESLGLVLQSLMNCVLPTISGPFRILIVNNYPPNDEAVVQVIKEAREIHDSAKKWQWLYLNRQKSIPPVENWYSAIDQYAYDGDVVFLHGDDDLFLKDSIVGRFEALKAASSDILVTPFYGGITFSGNKILVWDADWKQRLGHGQMVQDSDRWITTPFISSQVFFWNQKFLSAKAEALKWANEQPFIEPSQRYLMMPYYIPLAYSIFGFKVAYQDRVYVLRGSSLDDRLTGRYGVPGWNSGFLNLLAFDVLQNETLRENTYLSFEKKNLTNMISYWFWAILFDKTVKRKYVFFLLRRSGIRFDVIQVLCGIKLVINEMLNLKAGRIRMRFRRDKNVVRSDEFVKML